jgi:large subunit ribosomal protein L25
MTITLKAEPRDTKTKGELRKLRNQGKIPGVVYGKKAGLKQIAIEQRELLPLLKHNRHAIVEMDIPQAGKQPVMISEVQRDKLTGELLHIDFHQINMDEPVRTVVAIEFEGEAAGAKEGGIFQVQKHEIEIRCLPQNIPNVIKVDVSGLAIGESILVGDIQLPDGIELKSDPNELLATVLAAQKEETEDEAAETETPLSAEAETKEVAEKV